MSVGSELVRHKFNVAQTSDAGRPMLFVHGFGCDQAMWRDVAPAFSNSHRVILFDNMGAGGSDIAAYDPLRYATLEAYADDVTAICEALGLEGVILVGHSVGATIALLAAVAAPERFESLVLIASSPCYLNDGPYRGGFDRSAIEELLDLLDGSFLAGSRQIAPLIMGNPDRPALGERLAESLCRTHPGIARQFARVTFLSDHRADLRHVRTPSLILQCAEDRIAPDFVGGYLHEKLADSRLVRLAATGHCPQVSHPGEVIGAIAAGLELPADPRGRVAA